MALVVEILDRAGKVRQRYFINGADVGLGRAYDNEIILDDIHADTYHARLIQDEESQLLLIDNKSLNGIRDTKGKTQGDKLHLDFGQIIVVGNTHLRVIDPHAPLPLTKNLKKDPLFYQVMDNLWFALGITLLVALYAVYESYVNSVDEIKVNHILTLSLGAIFAFAVIALALSFIARVIRRRWNFCFNLSLLAGLTLLYDASLRLTNIVAFNYPINSIKWQIDLAWLALMVGLFTWGITRSVLTLSAIRQKILVASLPILVIVFTTINTVYDESREFSAIPPITKIFQPQIFQFRSAISDEEFAQQSLEIYNIELKKEEDKHENALNETEPNENASDKKEQEAASQPTE